MAAAVLKRGEAIVWLPPRALGERALAADSNLLVVIGSGKAGSAAVRVGLESLPPMRSARLVLDARDVTLLRAGLPALPAGRLQRALPNLLEDQLLQDAQACAWALGPVVAGRERLVAAVDRGWLETVTQAFERRGVRVSAVWPAQALTPADRSGTPVLLCVGGSVAVLPTSGEGVGLAAGSDASSRRETLRAALALLGEVAIARFTVLTQDEAWRDAAREVAEELRIQATLGDLPIPQSASVDLLEGRRGGGLARWLAALDWRAWRWPAVGAVACAAIGVSGLNLQWFALRQEQAALAARLDQAFMQVFPAGTTRVDPVLQLQRHVAQLRARSGQASADDFLPLAVGLGLALGTQAHDALGTLEYRDGRLRARFRPGIADTRAARDALVQAARRQGLQLAFESEREPLATVTVLR